jgi:hypothetical protein
MEKREFIVICFGVKITPYIDFNNEDGPFISIVQRKINPYFSQNLCNTIAIGSADSVDD